MKPKNGHKQECEGHCEIGTEYDVVDPRVEPVEELGVKGKNTTTGYPDIMQYQECFGVEKLDKVIGR